MHMAIRVHWKMIKLFLLAIGFFAPAALLAQALPSNAFTYTQQANSWTFQGGPATSANASSLTFGNAANGSAFAQTTRTITAPGGVNIPITVRGGISNADAAKALGRFALKIAGPLAVGAALYDLSNELGFAVDNSSGQLVVQKTTVGTFRYTCFQGGSSGLTSDGGCLGLYLEANRRQNSKCTASQGPYTAGTAEFQGVRYAFNSLALGASNCPLSAVISTRTMISTAPSFLPATLPDLERDIAAKSGWPSGSHIGRALEAAVKGGETIPLSEPVVSGPLSVPLSPVETINPDGSKTTVIREKTVSYGPGATVRTSTRETTSTTSPSGVVAPGQTVTRPDEPVVVVPDPAIQTTPVGNPNPAPDPEPVITCGLPDTPACVLDGTGIPTAQTVTTTAAKDAYNPIKDLVDNPTATLPQLPSINWAFALPSSCSVLDLGDTFAPFLTSIDICRFQPMFHDIMSLVWALGGLFGAISLFMRTSLSQ
jgi:Tfp pilus assembly protein PilV